MGSLAKLVDIDETVDGVPVKGTMALKLDVGESSTADPDLVEDDDFTSEALGEAILDLPKHPKGAPTDTDVLMGVHFGKTYQFTKRELFKGALLGGGIIPGTPGDPGNAPDIGTLGTRGTVNIADTGFQDAVRTVKDGGKIFVPYGQWAVASPVDVPGNKDILFEGESELGSEIVVAPGVDCFRYDDLNVQRRLQNRQIFRNLRFYMKGGGNVPGGRLTQQGWHAGNAAIAFVQNQQTPDGNRKEAWGNSYVTLENVTCKADKNAIGATLLWSERALYGLRARHLFLGDHGNTVSGPQGGIILGRPRFPVAEYAPDEFRIESMVHWGGVASIAVSNVANGAIIDHKAYACRYPLHLTGQDNDGPRKRGRDLELRELYYDNDVLVSQPGDAPMVIIDVDGCVFGVIHLKGSRDGKARPTVRLTGQDIEGGQFRLMGSSRHRDPKFIMAGEGHEFKIRAGSMDSQERATLINGKPSYPGVTVA
ncbi:MAG: hypothetical protein ACR2QH_19785 [Geminicoccaceae bacterium]